MAVNRNVNMDDTGSGSGRAASTAPRKVYNYKTDPSVLSSGKTTNPYTSAVVTAAADTSSVGAPPKKTVSGADPRIDKPGDPSTTVSTNTPQTNTPQIVNDNGVTPNNRAFRDADATNLASLPKKETTDPELPGGGGDGGGGTGAGTPAATSVPDWVNEPNPYDEWDATHTLGSPTGGGGGGNSGSPISTIAKLQQQLQSFYPEFQIDDISGTYVSPWTGKSYRYNSAEQLEQYMNLDNTVYQRQIADQREQELAAMQEQAIKAATEKQIAELNNAYNNSVSSYDQQRGAIRQQQANEADNLALQLANVGDRGGVGQKQYSDAQYNYDRQYLALVLEQQNFKNQTDQAIAQAQYDGDIALAEALTQLRNEKLSAYADAVNNYHNQYVTNSDRFYNRKINEYELAASRANSILNMAANLENAGYTRDYNQQNLDYERALASASDAYQKAQDRLKLGAANEEDAATLGISPENLKYWNNYYKTAAANALRGGSGSGSGGSSNNQNKAKGEDKLTRPSNTYWNEDGYLVDQSGRSVDASFVPSMLDYSPDEGVFTWMGKNYTVGNVNSPNNKLPNLLTAIQQAAMNNQITDADIDALAEKLKGYGFDVGTGGY